MNDIWAEYNPSVVVVIGNDKNGNEEFGTGFVYAADERYSYVLTCRHLLERLPWHNVKIDGCQAQLIHAADIEEQDYVILAVEGIQQKHPPITIGRKNGFPPFPSDATAVVCRQGVKSLELKPLHGKIVEAGRRECKSIPGRNVTTLTFVSDNGDIYDGYSGGPLILDGRVIGFITATRPEPKSVEIIRIENVNFSPQKIQFKNRETEKEVIIEDRRALKLITAPTGYGKTMLLWEVLGYYKNHNWKTSLYQIREKDTLHDVALSLALQINPYSRLPREEKKEGSWFARQVADFWKTRVNEPQGIAIFIDLQDRDEFEFRDALIGTFIPEFFSVLEYYSHKNELSVKQLGNSQYLRVFIAGRHLATDFTAIKSKHAEDKPLVLRPHEITLSPFEWRFVVETAEQYLSGENARDVASHAFFASGGHPGAIAHILYTYNENSETDPASYFNALRSEIWQESILPAATKVLHGIAELGNSPETGLPLLTEEEAKTLFETLILRYWHPKLIKEVLAKTLHKTLENGDEYHIWDRLKSSGLLTEPGETNLQLNDTNRRLLLVKLRQSEPSLFQVRCVEAIQMCLLMLKERGVMEPQLWARDYLLYSLLQYSHLVYEAKGRDRIRQSFDKDIEKVISILTKVKDHDVVLRNVLKKLDANDVKTHDWELVFTINFFLREGSYSDEPINKVRDTFQNLMRRKNKKR